MRVYTDLNKLPSFKDSVVTIGSFDGLHKGHQIILDKLKDSSNKRQSENIVVTFHPHPRSIVYPKDKTLRLLSTLNEKIELFRKQKIDNLVIVPFTVEFSQLSPTEYVENFLIKCFNPKEIIIGYDHRFGLNRAGDIHLLKQITSKLQIDITEISKQEIETITISSSKIRKAILSSDLESANMLLDRPYEISGEVIKGRELGATIGYPTANLKVENPLKLIPKDGIYACEVVVEKVVFQGMLYIGDIPTIKSNTHKTIEVNIFDFNQNIYGHTITLKLYKHLRDDAKFDSLETLKSQLAIDKADSLAYFGSSELANLNTTIAILNYNTQHYLEAFLPSIGFSSESLFDTLVIDNNSSDDSTAFVSEWFPETNIIQLNNNTGFAGGYNSGLANVSTKYIAFVNSDVQVTQGWLDPLIEYLEKNNNCAGVMPKILSFEEKTKFEYAGAAGGFLDLFGYPFCQGRIFDDLEIDNGQYDEIQNVFWLSGAAFVLRTDIFNKLGGFDSDYFAHQEEIDLCWRIKNLGYNLCYIPQSKIYHVGGGTLDYDSPRKLYLNFRNNLYTIFKNEKAINLIWKLPLRFILDILACVKFLMSGNFKSSISVITAQFAFIGHIFKLLHKRKANKLLMSKYKIDEPDYTGRIKKSIVWQYFILGKKTFSDIIN